MCFKTQIVHCTVMFKTILNEIPKPAVVLHIPEEGNLFIHYSNNAFNQLPYKDRIFTDNPDLSGYCLKLLAATHKVSPDNPIKGNQTIHLPGSSGELELQIEFTVLKESAEPFILAVLQIPDQTTVQFEHKPLIEDAGDICVILNKEGNYLSVSNQFTEIMGYKTTDVIGTNVFELVHPEDRKTVKENFQRLQQEVSVFAPPFRFLKKDHSWCWLQSVGTNLLETDPGKAIVVTSMDITQLVQAQQELQLSNERYQLISKASKDALYDWDIQQDIFYWGDGFNRLFGYPETGELFRLSNWIALTHHQDVIKHEQRWNNFWIDPFQNSWTNEFRFRKADGSYAYVEEIAYLIRDKKGKPIRMIGTVRDISDAKLARNRKQLEQNITQLFRSTRPLNEILQQVVDYLAQLGYFELSEIWLCSSRQDKMRLIAYHWNSKTAPHFYPENKRVTEIKKGKGFIGKIWQTRQPEHWSTEQIRKEFVRAQEAEAAGIESISGIPLTDNNQLIGAVVFGRTWNTGEEAFTVSIIEAVQHSLGAEIRRKQQEDEMRLMFESSPDIIAIISPDGYFTRVNPAFCTIMGYSAQELTSKPFHYFVHPDDLEYSLRTFSETLIIDEKATNFVNRYVTRSGEQRWISWSSSEAFGDENQAFAYGRDITEMKQLEELIDSTSKLARVGSWEINMADKKIFCSKITRDILELKPNQQLQLNSRLEYIRENSKEKVRRLLQAAIFDREPWDIEIEIDTAQGSARWVRLIGQASFKNGRCDRIYGSIQDIHEKKLYEASLENLNLELNRINQELKSSNAELEQFAFVASHDLQEPLRMITGFLTMLEKKYGPQLDTKANQYIYYAVDGAKRMRGIILDLLEYSRVGRMNTTLELVNPELLIREVKQLLQNQIEEKSATINTNSLPRIATYKIPLQQVLQNLVSNAIKYSHPDRKPEVLISVTDQQSYWEFSVQDNGIGIEPDAHDKIFVIFQRLNYTPDIPGSGMGLAIAKKIIEWQGGKIWVESEPGQGSTFYFTLPKTGADLFKDQ